MQFTLDLVRGIVCAMLPYLSLREREIAACHLHILANEHLECLNGQVPDRDSERSFIMSAASTVLKIDTRIARPTAHVTHLLSAVWATAIEINANAAIKPYQAHVN